MCLLQIISGLEKTESKYLSMESRKDSELVPSCRKLVSHSFWKRKRYAVDRVGTQERTNNEVENAAFI